MKPLLPRNLLGRQFELAGLQLREIAQTPVEKPLDPFALAKHFKIRVVEPSNIRGLCSRFASRSEVEPRKTGQYDDSIRARHYQALF
jgi:hypothetical protein